GGRRGPRSAPPGAPHRRRPERGRKNRHRPRRRARGGRGVPPGGARPPGRRGRRIGPPGPSRAGVPCGAIRRRARATGRGEALSGNGRWVRGLRGATTAEANTPEAIEAATVELLQALFEANALDADDIASILFSVTDDLDAAFPAQGARRMGLTRIPLFCSREIPVPGSCPRCIRVLMHVNTHKSQAEMVPVYLREARSLRPDLEGGTAVAAMGNHRPVKRETIMRITPYVPGKPAEEVKEELGLDDVIKLASNESPIGPSPRAVEAVSRDLPNLHVYPDGAARALRGALAERLGVSADQIVVGNGSDEIIKLLAEAYFSAGDEVVFAQPTFGE